MRVWDTSRGMYWGDACGLYNPEGCYWSDGSLRGSCWKNDLQVSVDSPVVMFPTWATRGFFSAGINSYFPTDFWHQDTCTDNDNDIAQKVNTNILDNPFLMQIPNFGDYQRNAGYTSVISLSNKSY